MCFSCHIQTNPNYEQPPQSLQNLYFQSHFLASKINRIFLIFLFCKEYLTRRSTFINEIFENLDFFKYFVFYKCAQFWSALFIILVRLMMAISSKEIIIVHRCILWGPIWTKILDVIYSKCLPIKLFRASATRLIECWSNSFNSGGGDICKKYKFVYKYINQRLIQIYREKNFMWIT